jgi:phosphoenolpyruvate-protein phosphotransferase
MLAIDESLVKLGLKASGKDDAIRQVALILSSNNCVDPGYAESMLGREKQTATYLGNGIAIPHGLRSDASMIRRTAIAVAQFPDGVYWSATEKVYLVIGIAAKSDEHIQVLANLTGILQDEAASTRLSTTGKASVIVEALTQNPSDSVATKDKEKEKEQEGQYPFAADVQILGHNGLHARPATEFSRVARRFQADVRVRFSGKSANGKSMASLLTLGVSAGGVVRVLTRGPDAEAALGALEKAVASGLGDLDDKSQPREKPFVKKAPVAIKFSGDLRRGIGASPGLVIAPVFRLEKTKARVIEEAGSYNEERNKLLAALMASRSELQKLVNEVSSRAGSKKAAIFIAHQDIIDDADLLEEANLQLKLGLSAGVAFKSIMDKRASELAGLKNELLSERAQDVRDVLDRVLRNLSGDRAASLMKRLPEHPVILLAEDLTPSETVTLDPARVVGLVTIAGGPTSHTAILARTLGIPSVVGLAAAAEGIRTGTPLILDGDAGVIVVSPVESDLQLAREMAKSLYEAAQRAKLEAYKPAYTSDGKRLETVANVGSLEEVMAAIEAGAEGIGLLRTEFFFLKRDRAPDEEEQFQALLKMSEALDGLPLIIRTLDIGGDKEVPYLPMAKEENPFLGVRGIRLCFERPEIFEPQLRAIVRVAARSVPGSIKVMFPMIATVDEFLRAK